MAYFLHHLLEKSAKHYPNKPASTCKNRSISYQELESASNQLAHVLRMHGVERGDRVGLYLSKCLESVVAIFGILKAGAVYVPLDPSAPVRRLGSIIGNCKVKALIASEKKIADLTQLSPLPSSIQCLVLVDARRTIREPIFLGARTVTWEEVLRSPLNLPPVGHQSEHDLAYILYTSGSTGEPKGVMISHRASLSFVNWAHDCFKIQTHDRVSNHAPLHFDLSIFDIFATIKAGATLYVVPEELSVFPIDLANFIEEQRITTWYSVPSVLTKLVLHGNLERHQFSELRTVLFAGEVFPVKYLRQLKNLIPRAEFYNLYGPTETNVCTYYQVKDIPADRTEPFPIGKACANAEVFALNDRREIAAQGEAGELYVRGESLMNGYWAMPGATQEVLVPHSFLESGSEKMVYRTGDLVKLDQDGNYHFLGRRDNMVKSRGYRIELGEIETALYSHPKVEEAAVISIPDEEVGNRILAVVAMKNADGSAQIELKRFCAERIPKYMVPDTIEIRPVLPKTSTGKIDKALLLGEIGQGQVKPIRREDSL